MKTLSPNSEVKNGSGNIQGCMQKNISNMGHITLTFSPFTANQADSCLPLWVPDLSSKCKTPGYLILLHSLKSYEM